MHCGHLELFVLVFSVQMFLIGLLFFACRRLHIRPSDTIAIVFCGSQKSLTTGTLLPTHCLQLFSVCRNAYSANDLSWEHFYNDTFADLSSDANYSRQLFNTCISTLAERCEIWVVCWLNNVSDWNRCALFLCLGIIKSE